MFQKISINLIKTGKLRALCLLRVSPEHYFLLLLLLAAR